MKKYLVLDFDGTLAQSNTETTNIMVKYLKNNFGVSEEKSNNFFITNRGMGLSSQLEIILGVNEKQAKKIANQIYDEIIRNGNCTFFPGVIGKLKKLSKDYQLFVSTGNSTRLAEESLKSAGVYDLFTYVLGSEKVTKSSKHIDIFEAITSDMDFSQKAIFVGDGENDMLIANENNITFVHINETGEDSFDVEYEINSFAEISSILEKFEEVAQYA